MILVKDLVWIDQIIDNAENKGYIKTMKEEFNINCIQFKDVASGLQYIINSLKYKVIALMVSGRLFSSYAKELDKYKSQLTTVPLTIIFTSSVSKFKGYCECKEKIEDPFYNPGGVHDSFSPVKSFLQNLLKKEIPKIPCNLQGNPTNY